MVTLSPSLQQKLISRTVSPKTGTIIEKYAQKNYWNNVPYMTTVVRYGENTPLRKLGIDTLIKHNKGQILADRALFSGETLILSGATAPKQISTFGDFRGEFKKLLDQLRKTPNLIAEKLKANPGAIGNELNFNPKGYVSASIYKG